ncbi:hypothetical protein ECANGB1_2611 [Enterospora canceri]|uniref:Uncharacterized protein n=1 Tax=Enterospora canceri TaxID=1081671 RepID=A0A1Y1SAV8_9MICR|nr:hypothetical protein ECANGB1_2611 [Enterospora canceri]
MTTWKIFTIKLFIWLKISIKHIKENQQTYPCWIRLNSRMTKVVWKRKRRIRRSFLIHHLSTSRPCSICLKT